MSTPYYGQLLPVLSDLFAAEVSLCGSELKVGSRTYPIVDDVIILLPPEKRPPSIREKLGGKSTGDPAEAPALSETIQHSFGAEWTTFDEILPEHQIEFEQYFDQVDLASIAGKRVLDLGAGMGRWSYFLAPAASNVVLVDFSDAIFVARRNLRGHHHALFFMGDLTDLPFRDDAADLLISLGVLHHLPVPALDQVRKLSRLAPEMLIYLYSALEERPFYYRALHAAVTPLRLMLSGLRHEPTRNSLSWALTLFLYLPALSVFWTLSAIRLIQRPPFLEFYLGKGLKRIQQDAYDRFFTRIEQRVTRAQIESLRPSFQEVTVSNSIPYWHFTCRR